jgi:hypothetical protein
VEAKARRPRIPQQERPFSGWNLLRFVIRLPAGHDSCDVVDLYHAAFVSKSSLEQENERIRMSAVRKDLETCYGALQTREAELQQRISMLGRQAVMYKQGKNPASARKKMLERVRASAQASKIQNSMLMIDMHRSTIEGTVLDLSVLETLKASGGGSQNLF